MSSSYTTTASENMSLWWVRSCSRTCSGDMYEGDPTRPDSWVASLRNDRAAPKSVSFTSPPRASMRLAGLMSRCTRPSR